MDLVSRFIDLDPSRQAALDLFEGEWSSAMLKGSGVTSRPGRADLFDDPRLHWAAQMLAPVERSRVLELGPLEGAHSYMLQRMGAASITAIKANTRAFLKCLCIMEVFDLSRVRYELGSFVPYLARCDRFDILGHPACSTI